jgi:AcrR family transcriptional regulator
MGVSIYTQCLNQYIKPMKNNTSLRERKKAKVRDALIQAAMKLFTEKGFEETTIDEIVESADVSRRTFFRYFPSKDLIVFPHQDIYLEYFSGLLAKNRGEETSMAALRRASQTMARQYQSEREDHLIQQRIMQSSPTLIARGDKMDEDWEALIAHELIARQDDSKAVNRRARFLAGMVVGLYRVLFREWYASDCRIDLGKLCDDAMSLLEFGINGEQNASPADETKKNQRE